MSDHGLKNKITETQRVLCAKVEYKNDVASFDRQGVIDKQYVPEEKRTDTEFYVQVLERLLKWVLRVKLKVRHKDSWALPHDNAPSHLLILTLKHFMAQFSALMSLVI